MTPYYDQSGITIYHGDCLDVLPTLGAVDHVITDPPYSRFTHDKDRGNTSMRGVRSPLSAIPFHAIRDEERTAVSAQFGRLTRRWCLVWSDIEGARPWVDDLTSAGLEHVRIGVWVKGNPAPQLSGDRPGTGVESLNIAHATRQGKPVRKKWNGGGKVAVWSAMVVNAATGSRFHETQKPERLMELIVADFTDPGELILDPFMGSGTTLVAAKRLGRRAIGIEREEKYCEIAAKRLAQGALPLEFSA